jgi:hypothetical protein
MRRSDFEALRSEDEKQRTALVELQRSDATLPTDITKQQ